MNYMVFALPLWLIFSIYLSVSNFNKRKFFALSVNLSQLLGVIFNSLAFYSNGFKMPALGYAYRYDFLHQPITEVTRFFWLTDLISIGIGYASIGDVFIVTPVLILSVLGILQSMRKLLRLTNA